MLFYSRLNERFNENYNRTGTYFNRGRKKKLSSLEMMIDQKKLLGNQSASLFLSVNFTIKVISLVFVRKMYLTLDYIHDHPVVTLRNSCRKISFENKMT